MPVTLRKTINPSRFFDKTNLKFIHARPLSMVDDVTLCGLTNDEYEVKESNKKVTCSSCLQLLGLIKNYKP